MKIIFLTFVCLPFSLYLLSSGQRITIEKTLENMEPSKSKHYVFVPGSFHAAWCWYKMMPLLNKNGNTCEALDLPGHGKDTTPAGQVTLDSYVDAVCKALEKYDKPVVLIGHSRAGIVISQVAERTPEKVGHLVYLCAFLIPDGEPMVATALTDTASLLVSNLVLTRRKAGIFRSKAFSKMLFTTTAPRKTWRCVVPC